RPVEEVHHRQRQISQELNATFTIHCRHVLPCVSAGLCRSRPLPRIVSDFLLDRLSERIRNDSPIRTRVNRKLIVVDNEPTAGAKAMAVPAYLPHLTDAVARTRQ